MTKITGKSGTIVIGNQVLPVTNFNLKFEPIVWKAEDVRWDWFLDWSPVEITGTIQWTDDGLRWFEEFLILDDVIRELEDRRWAVDYTRQFFHGRPGMRLADLVNVERN